MPRTSTITSTSSTSGYTIDPYIYSLSFKMYGASGGGENIQGNTTLTRTAGTSGGETSFLGFTLTGGVGGGVTAKNAGGQGGVATEGFAWSGAGTSVSSANGNRGSLPTGGIGAYIGGVKRDGGNGSSGYNTYTSSSYHVFDNINNVHNFSQSGSTSDISLGYANPGAADGLSGFCPTNGKHYNLSFTSPYVNSSWTFSVSGVCNQAAGGGTSGAPYSYMGSRYKSSGGISLWFQTSGGGNGYIRCFTISTTGLKPGATGRGGGGSAVAYGNISYETFEATTDYTPGTFAPAVIGAAGTRGGTTGGCANGTAGRIELIETIFPQVYLTSNRYLCTPTAPNAILSWRTDGDADAIRWPTNGDITNGNLESNSTVTPTVTTTYTAEGYNTSNSDLVSFNPEASVTIVVISAPIIEEFTVPSQINYGSGSFNVKYKTKYANTSLKLEFFNSGYIAGPNDGTSVLKETVILTTAGSAETGSTNASANGTISYSPQWDNFGPRSIIVRLSGEGSGGSFVDEEPIVVIIDETPDNFIVDETDEKLKDQDPVYTPETEILSEMYVIDDIDIPVEIKSDYPILVDINQDNDWTKVRQI